MQLREKIADLGRWPKIVAVVAVVVVIGAGGFAHLAQPAPSEDVTADTDNSVLYGRLAAVGIDGAVVDITEERALVRYNIEPNRSLRDSERAALTAAAVTAPDGTRIVVEAYQGMEPQERLTVDASTAAAYRDGELTPEQLRNNATIEQL